MYPFPAQVLKMTNNFAAQVRDLAGKVTLLEEEKEKNAGLTCRSL